MEPEALLGGVLVSSLFVLGGFLWNRFWNPVRWHLRYNGSTLWTLKRVTGPKARSPRFEGRFTAPPEWRQGTGDLPTTNSREVSHAMHLARDEWRQFEYHPEDRNFVLKWNEWRGARSYEFEIYPNTLDIDVRRRDIRQPTRRRRRRIDF